MTERESKTKFTMTMLEKAARALWESWADAHRKNGSPLASETWEGEPHQDDVRVAVRAVILAIREPDEAMLEAAIAPYQYDNTPEFNAAYKRTVAGYMAAMIDAILAEKP